MLKRLMLAVILIMLLVFLQLKLELFTWGRSFILLVCLIIGLTLLFLCNEPTIIGFESLGIRLGLSEHMVGLVSSIASNLPEAVLAIFMVLSPHLKEIAILTVMLASAFNGLLLGLLVILLTGRGQPIRIPKEALEYDVEVMRITIAFSLLIFGTGIILNVFKGIPRLAREMGFILLIAYLGYLYFISKRGRMVKHHEVKGYTWIAYLIVGLAGILASSHAISSASEYMVHKLNLPLTIASTIIAFAGSIPEHSIAVLGAWRGKVKMGVSNLVSGIVQSIMLIFPILAIITPIYLDGYILYQFLAVAVTLWVTLKAIVDDGRLTLDEGILIFLIHLAGIILFDELTIIV